jgi:hypothetical protein
MSRSVQGATVAPEKASPKKDATPKKGAPKGQKAAKGAKAKKAAKAGKKATKPAPAKEASTPRAESKGAKILALISRAQGRQPGRDHESYGLVAAFSSRLPLHRRQEARPQDRVREDGSRRSRLYGEEVGRSESRGFTSRRPQGLAAFLRPASRLHSPS